MGTIKRKKRTERFGRITPEAVAAFQRGDVRGLHKALGLKPWQESPLWVGEGEPHPSRVATANLRQQWDDALALRRALLGAGVE